MQSELNEEHKKELECQLHAADHNKLNEIAAGLLVSANHLVKVYNYTANIITNRQCIIIIIYNDTHIHFCFLYYSA